MEKFMKNKFKINNLVLKLIVVILTTDILVIYNVL